MVMLVNLKSTTQILDGKYYFSSISSSSEDINTTKLLQHIATEAGFNTDFEFIENVQFSDEGIFKDDELLNSGLN